MSSKRVSVMPGFGKVILVGEAKGFYSANYKCRNLRNEYPSPRYVVRYTSKLDYKTGTRKWFVRVYDRESLRVDVNISCGKIWGSIHG